MADASRFPRLALPFAVIGASAGWLYASLLENPLLGFDSNRLAVAPCAAALAALAGVILKRLCVGRRYRYELGDPDPGVRSGTDTWLIQVPIVVAAGAATGALLGVLSNSVGGPGGCAASGALGALLFAPVCLSTLAAARRAQRARLGSTVAGADRRAVWGILAITLAVMTLAALPDWPAWVTSEGPAPLVALGFLPVAAAVTLGILLADRGALARAKLEVDAALAVHEPAEVEPGAGEAARLDLGLGDQVLVSVARGAAYRQQERTVALVRGGPLSLVALQRAVWRGVVGLGAIAAVGAGHVAAATSSTALALYQQRRCASWNVTACRQAAELVRKDDPKLARALLRRGGGS
jgi:hypothetical protein